MGGPSDQGYGQTCRSGCGAGVMRAQADLHGAPRAFRRPASGTQAQPHTPSRSDAITKCCHTVRCVCQLEIVSVVTRNPGPWLWENWDPFAPQADGIVRAPFVFTSRRLLVSALTSRCLCAKARWSVSRGGGRREKRSPFRGPPQGSEPASFGPSWSTCSFLSPHDARERTPTPTGPVWPPSGRLPESGRGLVPSGEPGFSGQEKECAE